MIATLHRSLIAKRDEANENDKGFTLIELLVVVLIIGILAAIAIPVFLAQQDQARNGAVKSDLGNAKVAYVSYVTDKGAAPTAFSQLSTYGAKVSDGVTITLGTTATTTTFCLTGTNSKVTPAVSYKITDSKGVEDGACS